MICTINKVLDRYGSEMTLHRQDKTISFRGFLQPFRSKSLQNTRENATMLGIYAAGQYVLLAPGDLVIEKGDDFCWGEHFYTVKQAETVMAAGKAAYRWCICVKKGGEDSWGS